MDNDNNHDDESMDSHVDSAYSDDDDNVDGDEDSIESDEVNYHKDGDYVNNSDDDDDEEDDDLFSVDTSDGKSDDQDDDAVGMIESVDGVESEEDEEGSYENGMLLFFWLCDQIGILYLIDFFMMKNVIVGKSDEKVNADQDSDASEEEDDQFSCDGRNLKKRKGYKTSESDESEPEDQKASSKKCVSEESTPTKVVYDFQGSKSFQKLIHSPGSGVSVHLPLKHDLKGMSYYLVILPRNNEMWWMDGKLLQGIVNCVHKDENPNVRTPLWLKTFEKYHIRSEPHGNNSYKVERKNFVGHIGFVFDIKTKSATNAMDEIKAIVKFIYGVMQTYADSGVAGSTVLDYLETTEGCLGLFKYFTQTYTGVPKQDLTKVQRDLESDMKRFSQKSPQFEEGFHLDTFLPDYDIKKLLEDHIGCNSWNDARIGVRKACYKDRYKKEMLPEWGKIEKQELRK